MKIAILTLPLHSNYGGIIQNYALQTVLERMGHEVYTININKPKVKMYLSKSISFFYKGLIKKIIGRKDGILFVERKLNRDKIIVEQHVRRFINNNIHLTQPYYTKTDLSTFDIKNFNAVIVGSDQVWRIPYAYPDIETYFLDFIKGKQIKKIAYSASFGTDEIEFSDEQIKKCGELIKEFEAVTVREQSAIQLINNIYKWECKTKPVHTLDPTMLLSKEDYIKISAQYVNTLHKGGLFYYILDMTEEKMKLLQKISSDLGLEPFTIKPKSTNWFDKAEDKIAPPIEKWLQAFNQASFIFTDSFHGSVFSIIFNKEFITIGNQGRGMTRFHSLINLFNLRSRFLTSIVEYSKQTSEAINWSSVNEILEKEREISLNILKQIN